MPATKQCKAYFLINNTNNQAKSSCVIWQGVSDLEFWAFPTHIKWWTGLKGIPRFCWKKKKMDVAWDLESNSENMATTLCKSHITTKHWHARFLSMSSSDLIQCPYCQRRFNESAAQGHIKFCRDQAARMGNKSKLGDVKKTPARTQVFFNISAPLYVSGPVSPGFEKCHWTSWKSYDLKHRFMKMH